METNYRAAFTEIREQAEANPSLEGRATAVQHRIRALYLEALAANDLSGVRAITEELGKFEVVLGQSIARGPEEKAGKAGA